MKLSFRNNKEHKKQRLDLTPLIDVVFLLLIFFLLTSEAVIQTGIRVQLPSTLESAVLPAKRVEIYITAENRVYCDGKSLSAQELLETLRKKRDTFNDVLIYADVDCRHGKVMDVEDLCRRCEYKSVSVATSPLEEENVR